MIDTAPDMSPNFRPQDFAVAQHHDNPNGPAPSTRAVFLHLTEWQ